MKKSLLIIVLSLFPSFAIAETPCPNEVKTDNAIREGGCEADLDAAPKHLDFGALKQQMAPHDAVDTPNTAPTPHPQPVSRPTPTTCTYRAYAWDTKHGRSTDHFEVSKAYSEVTESERDPHDARCTICSEDQVTIDTGAFGLSAGRIQICWAYADQVSNALKTIAQSGEFTIEKLEGYRPGRTRGALDKNGLRTEWSNHSFGAALDINAHKNAIYTNCPKPIVGSTNDVKTCKKGIGGAYDPAKNPKTSIKKDDIVYREFTQFWKWGGEIEGSTKDIMHFSITGY